MKKRKKKIITTLGGLAVLVERNVDLTGKLAESIAEDFSSMNERFDKVDTRFDSLELEMRSGFEELNKKLDRIDTRIAALELAVFGATTSDGARLLENSLLTRLSKLEKAVFRK